MAELGELKVPAPSPSAVRTRSAARRGGEATRLGAAGWGGRGRRVRRGLQGCAGSGRGKQGLRRHPGGGAAGQMQGWGGGGKLSPLGAEAQGAGTRAVAAFSSRWLQGSARRETAAPEAEGRVHQAGRCGSQGGDVGTGSEGQMLAGSRGHAA